MPTDGGGQIPSLRQGRRGLFDGAPAVPGVGQFFIGEGPAGLQAEDEPAENQRSDGENGVADGSEPNKGVDDPPRHEFRRTGVPGAVFPG